MQSTLDHYTLEDMYTILLVDDETTVRDIIRGKTPWEQLGFTVIGEAGNGMEALEAIEERIPDVVITDIKMPYMDGIALAQTIQQRYPAITTVILSGFDEFSYAQSAIRYNVSEYVLKPVSSEDLNQLLSRLKTRLDTEITKRNDLATLQATFREILPLMREKFLLSLLTARQVAKDDDLMERARLFGIALKQDLFMVAVLEVTHPHQLAEDKQGEPRQEQLIGIAIIKIVNEILDKEKSGSVAVDYNNQTTILFSMDTPDPQSQELLFTKLVFRKLEHLRAYIQKYLGVEVTIGAGSPVRSLKLINHSYAQAVTVLNHCTFFPNQDIVFIKDMEPRNAAPLENLRINDQLRTEFTTAIKLGDDKSIKVTLQMMFDELAASNPTQEGLQTYMLELLGILSETAAGHGVNLARLHNAGTEANLFGELQNLTTIGKAFRWVSAFACKLREAIYGSRQNSHIRFVEDAKQMIFRLHTDMNLGLETVCDQLGVSPSYFSSTFKRETGTSFVQYLTMTRMERAKELLKGTELKTYEIAEAVGISESNYFSFCFKRYAGISPSQYRSSARMP